MKAVAVLILEILTRKLKSNLVFFLTLRISKAFAVQTPHFDRVLLNQRRTITHDLEALAVVVHEISTAMLKSNLVSFLTLTISKGFLVQTPDSEKKLVN